ncbi:MAG: hypothetical protein WDM87_17040 [Terracidiphilus sp.]
MEYRWPRYEENPDRSLVERHDREIAPLLKRRWLFAESGNFLLYDFFAPNGSVNEDVFAYSNRNGGERALVVYHNRYANAHGTVDFSASYADKGSGQLQRRRLSEGLGLSGDRGAVIAWRDSLTGLEYLRRAEDLLDRGLTLDLHAYQCHVFLDWHELRPSREQPWDRLSDWLNGRGVPNLADELVNLELKPVHDALRQLLDPVVVRHFADIAEHPRAVGAERVKKIERQRSEFLKQTWRLAETFLREAQTAYAARLRAENQPARGRERVEAASQVQRFNELLRAAMRMPQVEALFPAPWTAAARRMLPSPSPQATATEMWGPVLAWCALQLLAEGVDKDHAESAALDIFDRLRLRAPLAHVLAALGFEGEEAWRVAARIKVLLLASAGIGKVQGEGSVAEAKSDAMESRAAQTASLEPSKAHDEKLALAPALWLDPDVRWLCGVHDAEGHAYLIREQYEELLWWLLMPSLLRLAGEAAPIRVAVAELSETVAAALASAEAAGYRIDVILGTGKVAAPGESPKLAPEKAAKTKPRRKRALKRKK